MLPIPGRRKQRLRIGDAEAGNFVSEIAVDRGHLQNIFESPPHRERRRIEGGEQPELCQRIAAEHLADRPAFTLVCIK